MDSSLREEETLHRDDAIAVSIGMQQPGQGGRFRAHTSFLHNVRSTSERGSFRGLPSLYRVATDQHTDVRPRQQLARL